MTNRSAPARVVPAESARADDKDVHIPAAPTAAPGPASGREGWVQTWQGSDLHARVERGFGQIPGLLDVTLPADDGVLAAPAHWHCALYGDLVLGKTGTTFTSTDCYRALRSHGITWDAARVREALCDFLAHLRTAGHVDFTPSPTGRPVGTITVLADLRTAPPTTAGSGDASDATGGASGTPLDAQRPGGDPSEGVRQDPEPASSRRHQPPPQPSPPTQAPAAAQASPVELRKPRTAKEAAWLQETTQVLRDQGLTDDAAQALLALAKWGSPVLMESIAP